MNKIPVFVFGAGGHAKVVIDVLSDSQRYKTSFIVDDAEQSRNTEVLGVQCIGGRQELAMQYEQVNAGIVAIGDNMVRRVVAEWLINNNFELISAIHPKAIVANSVEIGSGTVVMPAAVINPDVRVGSNVIINTNSTIEHDCLIGDCVHVAPGAILSGGVTVGKNVLVGASAVVLPGVHIGDNSIVGANATVLSNVPGNTTVAGSPARVINT